MPILGATVSLGAVLVACKASMSLRYPYVRATPKSTVVEQVLFAGRMDSRAFTDAILKFLDPYPHHIVFHHGGGLGAILLYLPLISP